MTIYKRNFDENKHTYFLIKAQKVFIKYMKKTTEKVGNIKNKTDSELKKKSKNKNKKKKTHTHTQKIRLSMFICINNID